MITTLKEWMENLPKYLTDKQEHIGIVISEQLEVNNSGNGDCNEQYCIDNNIPCYNEKRDGGTIVCSKGNITLGFIYNNQKYKQFMFVKLFDDLCEYFKAKGLNAVRNKNDILIDSYKVASGCGFNLAPDYKWTYEGGQISINQDINAIKNICKKPMAKIPKGLSEYGITTIEMKNWVENWFKENTL